MLPPGVHRSAASPSLTAARLRHGLNRGPASSATAIRGGVVKSSEWAWFLPKLPVKRRYSRQNNQITRRSEKNLNAATIILGISHPTTRCPLLTPPPSWEATAASGGPVLWHMGPLAECVLIVCCQLCGSTTPGIIREPQRSPVGFARLFVGGPHCPPPPPPTLEWLLCRPSPEHFHPLSLTLLLRNIIIRTDSKNHI